MTTVCLVSCSSGKRRGRHPAKDLYTSDLFKKSRQYAVLNSDRWYVLSAKYGLLHPDDLIDSYDRTLKNMPVADRREWAQRVFEDLLHVVSPGDRIISLAGKRYGEFIVPKLRDHGVQVVQPLEGLRIGQQLSWLKENT